MNKLLGEEREGGRGGLALGIALSQGLKIFYILQRFRARLESHSGNFLHFENE